MPLTRGDKTIIIGAVALAVTVVLGLAVLKKPFLFSSGPKEPAGEIPPAPTAASAPMVEAPVTPPPAAVARTQAPAPVVAAPVAAPTAVPQSAPTAPPKPAASAVAKSGPVPPVAGDDTLEKMFAEIAGDSAPAGKPGEPKAAGARGPAGEAGPAPVAEPKAAPALSTEPGVAPAPSDVQGSVEPAPAPAPVKAKPKTKAELKAEAKEKAKAEAKAPAEAKPGPATKPAPEPKAVAAKPEAKTPPKPEAASAKSVAGGGNVVRIVAQENPGEYVLVIHTNKAPASFTKTFMTDPPRLVLDLGGAWSYNGPLSSVTGNDFIRQIRVGKHPDMFRVVLDMAPDATSRLRGAPTLERVPEGVALKIPK